MPARAIKARSYAELTWPSASRPCGLTARVSSAPRLRALSFIKAAVAACPPAAEARVLAASLPDTTISAVNNSCTG